MHSNHPRVPAHRVARAGVLLVAALLATPAPAHAHGGQFRAPGGPPPSGPGLGPAPVPAVITPGESWRTAWDVERLASLPGRDERLSRAVVTPGEEPRDAAAIREGWARRREQAARGTVVPYLLRLVDPKRKTRDEVRAAALIALGKTCTDRVVIALFRHWLQDEKAGPLVRESAALALGLLRRTQPSLQLPGSVLDRLREDLIRALDDEKAHIRVRSFAALALGLLGDQPFGSPYTKDGRLVVRALWKRFGPRPKNTDVPVCMLTALGMQPPAGVPDGVREGLRQIIDGRHVARRRWSSLERSHALTARARIGGRRSGSVILRSILRPDEEVEIRRAALIALAGRAASMKAERRPEAAAAVLDSLGRRRDPLTAGLALMAGGRLLEADLAEGRTGLLETTRLDRVLRAASREGNVLERGYAILALTHAARGARASGCGMPFYGKVRKILLEGLDGGRGDDEIRAAYAVGVGQLALEHGIDPLLGAVRDPGALAVLRGHAAVALGLIGMRRDEVRPALLELLKEKRGTLLRVRTALALALLGGSKVRTQLLAELKESTTEYQRAHAVIALGRLGDLQAVEPLLDYARDEKYTELSRALAVVALGMITDPESRPSIVHLSENANWPAGTQALYSAWSIL
ncbi:MAG: HEAT repeat domain-containing protein [Planctomycetota bacterium]